MALVGVLCSGCNLARAFGKDPLRAMLYHMRVPTFAQAMHTAATLLRNANRMMNQRSPQTRWASPRAGRTGELTTASASLPKPVMTPQKTMTRKHPMRTIESITESGTFRFGSFVSSANGADASHPVRPWTVNTTARSEPAGRRDHRRIEDVKCDAGRTGRRDQEPEDRQPHDDQHLQPAGDHHEPGRGLDPLPLQEGGQRRRRRGRRPTTTREPRCPSSRLARRPR